MLASLGAFQNEQWPPYTSHIAIELFKKDAVPGSEASQQSAKQVGERTSWFSRLFGSKESNASAAASEGIGRKKTEALTNSEKNVMDGHYVRYVWIPEFVPGGTLCL